MKKLSGASISGDLGAKRESASAAFFGRKIKRAGRDNPNPLSRMSKVMVESTPAVVGKMPSGNATVGGCVGGLTTGVKAPIKAGRR